MYDDLDLNWAELLDPDEEDYDVTDEQINELF